MKKSKFPYIIIFISLFIIMFLLIIFTDARNEKYLITSASSESERTVILDAGHGGIDSGAVGIDQTLEKDINLDITLKIRYLLELNGYNVILTRKDNNSIHDADADTIREKKISDIRNREKIITSNPNGIFVSIHQNKFYDSSVHGAQVFYSDNNPLSLVLAQSICDSVSEILMPEKKRQIKKSGTEIYLLYHSTIPSVMVECGFMSNPEDLELLKDESYQKLIAITIFNGIQNYFKGQ